MNFEDLWKEHYIISQYASHKFHKKISIKSKITITSDFYELCRFLGNLEKVLETLGKRFTGRYKYLENFDSFGTLQVYTESIILFLRPSSRGNFRNFDFLKTLQVKFKIAKSEFRGY